MPAASLLRQPPQHEFSFLAGSDHRASPRRVGVLEGKSPVQLASAMYTAL
jgi:hypothetical protein